MNTTDHKVFNTGFHNKAFGFQNYCTPYDVPVLMQWFFSTSITVIIAVLSVHTLSLGRRLLTQPILHHNITSLSISVHSQDWYEVSKATPL